MYASLRGLIIRKASLTRTKHIATCVAVQAVVKMSTLTVALTFENCDDIKNVPSSNGELTCRCRAARAVVIDDVHNFGFLSGAFFDLFFFSLASLKNSGALLIVSRAAMPIASASISDRKYS